MPRFESVLILSLPSKILFWGGFGVFLLWFFAPIDYITPSDEFPCFVLALYTLIFYVSMYLGCGYKRGQVLRYAIDVNLFRRLVNFIFGFGVLGLIIRLIDRVLIRAGGNISMDFMANREMFASEGGGILALIGGVLSSFLLFLPAFIAISRAAGRKYLSHWLMLFVCIFFALLDMLLQGSRSGLVIFLMLVSLSMVMTAQIRVRVRSAVVIGMLVIMAVWASGMMFWIRTTQMGLDPVASMTLSGYANFAPASQDLIRYLEATGASGLGGFIYAFTHLAQYMTHGVYEFYYVVDNVSSPSTYGMMSFYIPVKIWFVVTGQPALETLLQDAQLRPGVYTTLFGPLLYDFGLYGGLIASMVFGVVIGWVSRQVFRGNIGWFPMYLLFCTFVVFFPVVNLFVSGMGQYALLAALILLVCIRLIFKRAFIPVR